MRLLRSGLALSLALALGAGLLVATPPAPAQAAEASQFDPGNIISDAAFFDGRAMSESQVQSFLDSQVRTCATGSTCLKDYRQTTPSMAADAYCGAIPGRTNETASSIIARVGSACDVSQRVLLVLLQKEQSLVTRTSPSRIHYDRATGFACPDTAPCDSSYGSFFYQVYYAARQFQRYAKHPGNYQHRAGQQNRVLFHPNAACGSSTVLIANQATAGLYNYTPYQPNAAALANLYGTGDACSAYGNRNFWRMYTDWFGTTSEVGSRLLVREQGSSTTYLVNGTWLFPFNDPVVLAQYQSRLGAPQIVADGALASWTKGQVVTRWLRDPAGNTYFIDNGARFRFADCRQVERWGRTCGTGIGASQQIIDALRDGGRLQNIVGWQGEWWYVDAGRRQPIGDTANIGARGMSYDNTWMSPGALDTIAIGIPFLAEGFGATSYSGTQAMMRTGDGLVRLTDEQARLTAFSGFSRVTYLSTSVGWRQAKPLPNRIDAGGAGEVLTDRGLLEVSRAAYGGATHLSAMSAAEIRGVPRAGQALGVHYVAELGSTTAFRMMPDGKRDQLPVSQVAADARERGISAQIHRGVPGFLDHVPQRSSYRPGTLLRDSSSGELLLASASTTVRVTDARVVGQLGLGTTATEISPAVRNGLPAVGVTLDADYGVRCAVDGVASWGGIRPYASTAARAAWGLTHEQLPSDICARIPVGAKVDRAVEGNGGELWVMDRGQRRAVDSMRSLGYHGYPAASVSRISGYPLGARTVGAPLRPYLYSGTPVRSTATGELFLVDDHRLLPTTAAVIAELRSPIARVDLDRATISTFERGPALGTTLVEHAGIRYALIDGRLVRFPWKDTIEFGTERFTSISRTLFAKMTVSGWMSRWVSDSRGNVWYVTAGTRNLVDTPQERAAAQGQHIHELDDAALRQLPIR